jgi:glycosyltransferase involved in cell wall biosynthesis
MNWTYTLSILFIAAIIVYSFYLMSQKINDLNKEQVPWKKGDKDPLIGYKQLQDAGADIPEKKEGEKRIIWIMHSYVPNVLAGSEITAESQIEYLRGRGWTSYVLVHLWCVPEWQGTKIYPIKEGNITLSPHIQKLLQSADILAVQNYSINNVIFQTEQYKKPTVIFLHTQNDNRDSLSFRFGVPVYVVYNVNFLKLGSSNAHQSIVVHPKVDTNKFKIMKKNPKYVTLVNCNENKGGDLLPKIATALPEVKFMGVKGGYSKQIIDPNPPKNLTYIENQEDMTKVYEDTKILLMPSKSETWGRVAVEAMASGTPVIVNRSAGLMECVGKAANTCDRSDLSCWIETISTLMKDQKAYDEASAKALDRVKELDAEDEFTRLEGFLEDIRRRHTN